MFLEFMEGQYFPCLFPFFPFYFAAFTFSFNCIIEYIIDSLFLKVGGLGDVVAGLGKTLQKRGHLVEIILPKYDCMQYDGIGNLRV